MAMQGDTYQYSGSFSNMTGILSPTIVGWNGSSPQIRNADSYYHYVEINENGTMIVDGTSDPATPGRDNFSMKYSSFSQGVMGENPYQYIVSYNFIYFDREPATIEQVTEGYHMVYMFMSSPPDGLNNYITQAEMCRFISTAEYNAYVESFLDSQLRTIVSVSASGLSNITGGSLSAWTNMDIGSSAIQFSNMDSPYWNSTEDVLAALTGMS